MGIVGGMGPAATVDFFARVVGATSAARDQDHLHLIVDNDPSVPDRTLALEGRGEDPVPALVRSARLLERAGAEMIVIACNTAAAFDDAVQSAIGVPLIGWVGETAAATSHARYGRVGLLATSGTVRSALYQRALAPYGVAVVTPEQADQEIVMEAIYGPAGVKAGGGDPGVLDEVVERLCARGAEAALISCTDLSVLCHDARPWPVPALDAAQIVAERVVVLAGASPRVTSSSPDPEEESV